jgi:YVTN family beta-propeller protein
LCFDFVLVLLEQREADQQLSTAADRGDNTVSVIDKASNTVVATVPVGIAPIAVAVTPDGKYVYVANDPHSHCFGDRYGQQ